jgi:hypothetical protein
MLYFDTSYLVRLHTRTPVGRKSGHWPPLILWPVACMATPKPSPLSTASSGKAQ